MEFTNLLRIQNQKYPFRFIKQLLNCKLFIRIEIDAKRRNPHRGLKILNKQDLLG